MTQAEIDDCRTAFDAFDKTKTRRVNIDELGDIFEKLGKWLPTDEQLYQMVCTLQLQALSGFIDFHQFLTVCSGQKEKCESEDIETDLVDAFIACGGNEDASGNVKRDTLIQIIKYDFGLTIDIEELINKVDADGSGEIEFDEFKDMLA